MDKELFDEIATKYQEEIDKVAADMISKRKRIKSVQERLKTLETKEPHSAVEAYSLRVLNDRFERDLYWSKREHELYRTYLLNYCKEIERIFKEHSIPEKNCPRTRYSTRIHFTLFILKNIFNYRFERLLSLWTDKRVRFLCCDCYKEVMNDYLKQKETEAKT